MKKITYLIIFSIVIYGCKKKEETQPYLGECTITKDLFRKHLIYYDSANRLIKVSDTNNQTLYTYEYRNDYVLLTEYLKSTIDKQIKIYLNNNGTAKYLEIPPLDSTQEKLNLLYFNYNTEGYLTQLIRKVTFNFSGSVDTIIIKRDLTIENGCVKKLVETRVNDSILLSTLDYEYHSESPADISGFGSVFNLMTIVSYDTFFILPQDFVLPDIFGKKNSHLMSKMIHYNPEGGRTYATSFEYKLLDNKYIESILISYDGVKDSTYSPLFGYVCR